MSSFSPLVFMRSDMRYRSWFRVLSTLALLLCVLSPWAFAQEERSEVAIQGTGFYTKQSAGNGIAQHPTDTGGFLFSYRYHFNRWLAAEGSSASTATRNSTLFRLAHLGFNPMCIRQPAAWS